MRELILTLAVQGKLVPQDPKDEPASALLKKIRAEKDRLIAEGKIKRDKPLAEIAEEEKPFELPESWEWVRLYELLPEFQNGASSRGDVGGKPVTVIRLADIKNRRISLADTREIPIAERDIQKYLVREGDILITRVNGSADIVGQFNLCDTAVHAIYCDHFIRMRVSNQWIEPTFLALLNESSLMRRRIKELFITTAGQKTVNQGHIGSLQLSLPPLTEQSRIVTRVGELMRLCDALDCKGQLEAAQHAELVSTLLGTLTQSETPEQLTENWHRIATHFDLLLDRPQAVDALEQTILQLAVRGLLVPQDPQDEPASDLLKKIRAEKDKLIALGKIKRDKPLPPIAEDERPFVLPLGWDWARVADLCSMVTDGEHLTPTRCDDATQVPLVTAKNVRHEVMDYRVTDYVPQDVAEKCWQRCKPLVGDILMVSVGATLGRLCVLRKPLDMVLVRSVTVLRPVHLGVSVDFFALHLMSQDSQSEIWREVKQSAQPCLYLAKSAALKIALPPLVEQSRIVTRVASLRRLCADLRQRLTASQSTQAYLAEALVQGVG